MPRHAGGASGGNDYRRIVKVGDPARVIAETADRLGVDVVVMGRSGLGRRSGAAAGADADAAGTARRPLGEMGSVASSVLALTSKPVAFLG